MNITFRDLLPLPESYEHYGAFVNKVLVLAIPIALQRVVGVAVNLIDGIMVGALGDAVVSACAISNQFFLLFAMISGGFTGGAIIMSAQAWGKGDIELVQRLMSLSAYLSIGVSIVFFFLTQMFAESIISIYSNEASLIGPGAEYLRIISYSYLAFALTSSITHLLRTAGCIKLGLMVELTNSGCNVVLNYILIFGKFGAPALGMKGAAIATVISRAIGLAITLIYAFAIDKNISYRIKSILYLPDKNTVKTYVKCGIPILVGDSLIMINSTIQTMITGRISAAYITANSIVHVIWQIAALFAMGFEASASIIIGNDIGSSDMEETQKDGEIFFLLSILCGILSAVVVLVTGPIILSFYRVSDEAVIMAASMIKSAAIVVLVMVIQMIVTKGVIKAGGKTGQLMVVDVLSTFGFGIPLGYIAAFILKWPPYLVYIVIRGDYLIKALYGIMKLKGEKWAVELVR